jgi:hypothetical protein
MMHFSKSLLSVCLFAGQWLFLVTGGLALMSLASDWLRGDASGRPGVMAGIGVGCLALAALFLLLRRFPGAPS